MIKVDLSSQTEDVYSMINTFKPKLFIIENTFGLKVTCI